MSFMNKFGAPLIAAIAGVGIATYTLLPAMREQRDNQNRLTDEVKRTVASQEKGSGSQATAADNSKPTK
ncbi:hypothetical protein GGH94_006268 [Coemansia aciculifera]|uniref:Uncharacterized protein n=1 Tax=Coemansia aciculifera TaxID=417176 RepID=A0A9W8M0I1_9FUNG|nr:hypothetical protein GGH94_006268 [Coemansia aciculifera]